MSEKPLGNLTSLWMEMLVLISLAFDSFARLPEPLRPAATGVARLSSRYVVFDSANPQATSPIFNWDSFKDAIAARSKPDLVLVKEESTSIVNHTASVDDMAGKISQFLHDTFSLQGTNNEELHVYIRKAFEDVSSAGGGDFLSTYTHESHGRVWEYRLVSSAPHPDDADSFYTVVATVKLVADIFEHKGLFGIGNESKHDFSAHIRGVQLLVNKSYAYSA